MNTNTPANPIHHMIAIAAFVALAAGLPAASHASGNPADRSVDVEYAPGDLQSTQGAGKVYQRIRSAAENVCSTLNHGDLASKRNFRHCVDITIQDTVTKVNQWALTAAFQADYPAASVEKIATAQQR